MNVAEQHVRGIGKIYKLTSPSGKIYIGKTNDLNGRWRTYARYDCVEQRKLYKALLKYGWTSFKKEVIEECDTTSLSERETFWIRHFNSIKTGYNIAEGGEGGPLRLGHKNTEEHKRKCSISLTGKKMPREMYTDEYRAKLSAAAKKPRDRTVSDITRKKLSVALKGKSSPHTTLQNKRIGDALRGKTFSDVHRINISRAKIGVPTKLHTSETKEKLRQIALIREQKKREMKLSPIV